MSGIFFGNSLFFLKPVFLSPAHGGFLNSNLCWMLETKKELEKIG